jgi:hypothetical protein
MPVFAQVPHIASFSPTTAPPGSPVTISGGNFDPVTDGNIVYFGTSRANVLTASSGMLTVEVPASCLYGPIRVARNGLVATSRQSFLPTFAAKDSMDGRIFHVGEAVGTVQHPAGLTTGDVDGDGKLDLLHGSQAEGTVSILRNTSTMYDLDSGTFAPRVAIHTGPVVNVVLPADVDGDGRVDIIASNFSDYTLTVLRNVGSPGSISSSTLQDVARLATGVDPLFTVAEDLDGDGRVDLAVQNLTGSSITVFRNTSVGATSSASSWAPPVTIPTGAFPAGLAAGDLDGDGRIDLVVKGQKIFVHQNISTPGSLTDTSFAPAVEFPIVGSNWGVSLADMDGDGVNDIVVLDRDSTIGVLPNRCVPGDITTGSFGPQVNIRTSGDLAGLVIADFNGDGKPDCATSTGISARISIVYNQHQGGELLAGSFSAPFVIPSPSGFGALTSGDLDGDGRPDLALGGGNPGVIQLYRNARPSIGTSPVLVSPEDSATNLSTNLQLVWASVAYADAYHAQCGTDSLFSPAGLTSDSTLADTACFLYSLAYGTVYWWRVRAWNSSGYGDWSTTYTFRTTQGIPDVPLLVSPLDSAVSQPLSIELQWAPSLWAVGYHLRVWSLIQGQLSLIVDDSNLVETRRMVDTLRTGTWYVWSARAKGDPGYSGWSASWGFRTIVSRPFKVTLVSPLHGAVVPSDTVRLSWNRSEPEVSRYWIEAATDSLFIYASTDSNVLDTTYIMRGVQNAMTYWWRVRAGNDAGWGFFSDARYLSVVITGSRDAVEIPKKFALLQNYPNPVNPATVIEFHLPIACDVRLTVSDIVGRQVCMLVNERRDAGYHEVRLDGSRLSSGVYLYRLQAGGFIETRKLLLVK